MVAALFDTNILIDYLNNIQEAWDEFGLYQSKAISIVTWMEVMAGTSAAVEAGTRSFLDGFTVIALDESIAERAVVLRRADRMKLPDAVVWASAQVNGMLLVTRNTKDFPASNPGVRVPYVI
jgi:predicted nucleic acid-binding protein